MELKPIFSVITFLVFIVLSNIHIYWFFGGKWAASSAIPKLENSGALLFSPGLTATAIVALGLFFFGLISLCLGGIIGFDHEWLTYAGMGVATIFGLRAIGDFKYVGFFKRVRNTDFGRLDTRFYSPLCLLLSVMLIYLSL